MATATKSRAKIPAQGAPDKKPQRTVNGVAVIKEEEVPSPLSNADRKVSFKGLKLLTLEDGRTVFGCGDCDFTGSRGDITKHRGAKHGAKVGRPRGRPPTAPVLSREVSGLSVAELLEIAKDAPRWEEMFTELEDKAATWRERALIAEARVRQITVALDRLGFASKVSE